jgi:ATP diphosphatase
VRLLACTILYIEFMSERAEPSSALAQTNQPASVSFAAGDALARSAAITARLRAPDGCPWDREQTFDSIKRHTLEETYEVFDAIDRRDWPALKDELGDLLLQVLFYAQMADEAGYFSLSDVAENLSAKLIRRHPHVFADAQATTAEDVIHTWESVKQTERAQRGEAPQRHLDRVPQFLPALQEADKLGARASKVGFDWPSVDGLFAKLAEETNEIQAELVATDPSHGENADAVADEVGDLLFTAVNLARHLGQDAEFCLRRANRKFRTRFNCMEDMKGGSEVLAQASPEELELAWQDAKARVAVQAGEGSDDSVEVNRP